jgi:UDP-N-acetylglucosamine 2-epimerase (hydrolysing)
MKICIFVGSRANYGRLYSIIKLLKSTHDIILIGGCTLNNIKSQVEFEINYWVEADLYNDTFDNRNLTMSLIAIQCGSILKNEKPDLCICHGDRFEVLGFAQASSSQEIKLMHLEAGEKSGMYDDKIRYAISSLSDILLAPTIRSKNNLKFFTKKLIYNVGSPIVDYIYSLKLEKSSHEKVLVLFNPTNLKDLEKLINIITKLDKKIVWVNPNIDPGHKEITKRIKTLENIEFIKNVKLPDFINLLNDCRFAIGNSSAGLKEASVLGVPFIMVGTRQKDREFGLNVIKSNCLDLVSLPLRYHYNGFIGNGDTANRVLEIINEKVVVKND